MSLSARAAALTPPRAHGEPLAGVLLRAEPEDFLVEEDLGFAPAGEGQHLLVRVRKRNANTAWVAEQLAAPGRLPRSARSAMRVSRTAARWRVQWFSLPRPRAPLELDALRGDGFEALEMQPHNRKLPRGALAGNRFAIRLRALAGSGAQLAAALSRAPGGDQPRRGAELFRPAALRARRGEP